jgi:hypothetical protein
MQIRNVYCNIAALQHATWNQSVFMQQHATFDPAEPTLWKVERPRARKRERKKKTAATNSSASKQPVGQPSSDPPMNGIVASVKGFRSHVAMPG